MILPSLAPKKWVRFAPIILPPIAETQPAQGWHTMCFYGMQES